MSRTHRDQKKYQYKHHIDTHVYTREGWCECSNWHDYRWYEFPPPSWWNKDIRRKERAFTRNLMDRARHGHIDWERVDERRGDEWYW